MSWEESVSRETLDKLRHLEKLLIKWNSRINLVSKSTLKNAWERHVYDSVQVFNCTGNKFGTWLDIGSGGGFPGLVIAIIGWNDLSHMTMIESDQRKCAFLRTVLRETGVEATVLSERIEKAAPQSAEVISARALADLSTLFGFAERHLQPGGICLFQKGITWKKEVEDAQESWSFDYEAITSKTDPVSVILRVGDIERV